MASRPPRKKTAPRAPAKARKTASRVIKVDALARVEGEGALHVRVNGGVVKDVRFRIFEPPRFFEALLRGRLYSDAPDITARICGICPMAYIMGASQAMEDALKAKVGGPLRDLRRLAYCGEWIESHVLHAALLHAPDFLGLDDALLIAKKDPKLVETALRLKKIGNDILEAVGGGRAIHPLNFKVGGFYKVPPKARVRGLVEDLKWGVAASRKVALAFAKFRFPDFDHDYHCVSLRHPDEYAIHEGDIVSDRGLKLPVRDFLAHFDEEHVAHSNALHGMTKAGEPYLVGPIARYNNNFDQLSPTARKTAADCGLGPKVTNPFKSLLVRMVETQYAFEEALRIARAYEEPAAASVEVAPGAGEGHGCTEAPRGICYHTYRLDGDGRIAAARIVPPTAQNQKQIERDLRGVVERNLHLGDAGLKWRCEQTIRNYDPCISCATHFLKLTVERD